MIDLLFRLHLTSLDFSLGLRVPLEAVCYPEYTAASRAAFISSPTLKPPHGPAAAVIFFRHTYLRYQSLAQLYGPRSPHHAVAASNVSQQSDVNTK